jgi:hypothetical protein
MERLYGQGQTLVDLPPEKRAISSRWFYKLKPGLNGQGERYKARLVARGNEQKSSIDFAETFVPVAKWATINIISALVGHHGWNIQDMDVKTAFLNGKIQEEVYMRQPDSFIDPRKPLQVCKIHRALYGPTRRKPSPN